jgi:hypothetical protein
MAYMERKIPGYATNYIIKNKQEAEQVRLCADSPEEHPTSSRPSVPTPGGPIRPRVAALPRPL